MRLATFCSHLHSQCILLTGGAQNRTDQYLLSLGVKYGQDVALLVSAVLFLMSFFLTVQYLAKHGGVLYFINMKFALALGGTSILGTPGHS